MPTSIAFIPVSLLIFDLLRCTYTEHLMHEIRNLMQGFTVSQVTNNVVYICVQYLYHILGYLGNCEFLHQITDLVHEMLSVCAPLVDE